VEVPLTKEVTIGRLDLDSASFPDIDLTRDDALDKGSSRRQAKITRHGHQVFIEDLQHQRRRCTIMLYELSLVAVAVILIAALFIAAFVAS
jgi:hypothetical protein